MCTGRVRHEILFYSDLLGEAVLGLGVENKSLAKFSSLNHDLELEMVIGGPSVIGI